MEETLVGRSALRRGLMLTAAKALRCPSENYTEKQHIHLIVKRRRRDLAVEFSGFDIGSGTQRIEAERVEIK